MAERDRSPDVDTSPGLDRSVDVDLALETWTVATFNVVAFGLVLVLIGHASGALAEVLPDLGTLPGIAIFGYLWALVVASTRMALPEEGLEAVETAGYLSILRDGVLAGTVTGGAFVLGVVVVAVVPLLVLEGGHPGILLYLGGFGTGVGGIAGAVLGALFAAVDLLLFRAAAALVPET